MLLPQRQLPTHSSLRINRQRKVKKTALLRGGFDPDLAVVGADDALADGEADAVAVGVSIAGEAEAVFEDGELVFDRDAGACVGDGDL